MPVESVLGSAADRHYAFFPSVEPSSSSGADVLHSGIDFLVPKFLRGCAQLPFLSSSPTGFVANKEPSHDDQSSAADQASSSHHLPPTHVPAFPPPSFDLESTPTAAAPVLGEDFIFGAAAPAAVRQQDQMEQLSRFLDHIDDAMEVEEEQAAVQAQAAGGGPAPVADGSVVAGSGGPAPVADGSAVAGSGAIDANQQQAINETKQFIDLMNKLEREDELESASSNVIPDGEQHAALLSTHNLHVATAGLSIDASTLHTMKVSVLLAGSLASKMFGIGIMGFLAFQAVHSNFMRNKDEETQEHQGLQRPVQEKDDVPMKLGRAYSYQPPIMLSASAGSSSA